MSFASVTDQQPASVRPWLAIVGIGEDGIEGLTQKARDLIEAAAIVFGGDRHLTLAAPLIRGEARRWSRPFDPSLVDVLALRGRPVCVLASGDPFFHGVGSLLSRHVTADETITVPAISAFSLAASRLLWALDQTKLLSLCGRPLDLIRPHLQPGARILALTSGAEAPDALARLLSEAGFGKSNITVLEALGGTRERVRSQLAHQFDLESVDPLNVVAVEVTPEAGVRIVPTACGLDDDLFEHDGQITKREIRAITLSSLAPRFGGHLWDVGAGCGSIAIEWMRCHSSMSAVAIERDPVRARRIVRNASTFGVPHLQVLVGAAVEALQGLSAPSAIFIGGGATAPGLIEMAQAALSSGGRLVINAVTLETESILLKKQSDDGGSLARIDISRASPLPRAPDTVAVWRPAMPIVQWVWSKP
jgi:precorrin-6B C5,15-methyltransferase / cobalt-precorrin-6B C5,C15-methyltransferase